MLQGASADNYKKVKAVKAAMYEEGVVTRGCYKLLNASGEIGCQGKDAERIRAPVVHYKDLSRFLDGERVVIVPAAQMDELLGKFLSTPVLKQYVVAILVSPGDPPAASSVALPFPGAAYAPYNAPSYVWNPAGKGFNRQYFGIPIFWMTDTLSDDAVKRATYNARNDLKGGRHVAEMQMPMDGKHNSTHCLTKGTCMPVGGYGVWTALPPMPDVNASIADSSTAKPITLVVAHMDSDSLFHEYTRAVGTSLAGLVSMMAAATVLAASGAAPTYSRQVVFAALAGEAFDYMGSRRMLYEMSMNSSFVRGLGLDKIDQVLEIGPIGSMVNNFTTNTSVLYMHSQPGAAFGSAVNISAAVTAAASSSNTAARTITAQAANSTNPGIPPSSLMSFLRVKPSIAGMVLTDFDKSIKTPYFQSEFDKEAYTDISMQAMYGASEVIARALHTLVAGNTTPALVVNQTFIQQVVDALAVCLIFDTPSFACSAAAALMPVDYEAFTNGTRIPLKRFYPGVLEWVDHDPRASGGKPNLARFVYNYLGNITASMNASAPAGSTWAAKEGAYCDTTVNVCPSQLACIGWRAGANATKYNATMGRCRNTTTNYLPAYTTRLAYFNNYWLFTNTSTPWEAKYGWPADPMWTESNWPAGTPSLMVYQQDSNAVIIGVFMGGVAACAATALLSWAGIAAFEKRMKQQ